MPIKDNEAVYDGQIHPLMKQIIAICKEHGIPMVATFVYAEDGLCTTSLPVQHFYPDAKDSAEAQMLNEVAARIYRKPTFLAMTITTVPTTDGKRETP